MEQKRLAEDQELLNSGSKARWDVQNQLYFYIISRFEDDLEGHHAELGDMAQREHDNTYAFFIMAEISKKFASWFEELIMTEEFFIEKYFQQPEKVLEALVGPGNVEQYLRELEERFKVSLAPDASQEIPAPRYSCVTVHSVTGETCRGLNAILDSCIPAKTA